MRENPTFQSVFDALTGALNKNAAQVAGNADLAAKILECLNRAYARGYNQRPWEDAWDGAQVTPTAGVVDWSLLGDARRFQVWTADPRDLKNRAVELEYQTDRNGLHLVMSSLTSVWVMWLPKVPKFVLTPWATGTVYAVGTQVLAPDGNNYACATAHTAGDWATDLNAGNWTLLPLLAVLEEFTTAYARGTYLIETGQPQTGATARNDAKDDLEVLSQAEYARVQSYAWNPARGGCNP